MLTYVFTKNSTREIPKNLTKEEYKNLSYGEEILYEVNDNPFTVYHFSGSVTGSDDYRIMRSLKNTINYYSGQDEIYNFDNFFNKPTTLCCFNSLNLGSGLEKGTVQIVFYLSGNILASCSDFRQDGILYQENNDEKVGIVLYKEGFILINNTSSLYNDTCLFSSSHNQYIDNPKWINSFASCSSPALICELSTDAKNEVPSNTFFVYANKYDLNHSNNETYILSGNYWSADNEFLFKENPKIKNTIKSSFTSGSANFEKQTFITRIGLYDEEKNIIGYGSLATPVRKIENREYLFKLKIDL